MYSLKINKFHFLYYIEVNFALIIIITHQLVFFLKIGSTTIKQTDFINFDSITKNNLANLITLYCF